MIFIALTVVCLAVRNVACHDGILNWHEADSIRGFCVTVLLFLWQLCLKKGVWHLLST